MTRALRLSPLRPRGLCANCVVDFVAQSICLATLDTKTPALAVAVASIVNIMGDFALAPVWGIQGAAVATAMATVSSCAILVRQVRRKTRDWKSKLEEERIGNGNPAELAERFRMFSLFLLMLSVLVYASLTHGLAALKERRNPGQWRSSSHVTMIAVLGLLGLAVAIIGLRYGQLLLIIFAAISVAGSIGMFRDVRRPKMTSGELTAAHLNGLIGSGIGAYTAFFAFGGSRFLAEWLPGQWQVIPWVLPSIIGTVAIAKISQRFKPKKAVRAN